MLLRSLGLLALAAVVSAPGSALAQPTIPGVSVAVPGTVEDTIGQVILYFVGGRTKFDAMQTSNDFDPYQINPDDLLYTVGAFFMTYRSDGTSLREGELALFPQFTTPLDSFEPSVATPAIIPFALMQQGTCHAGYVAGHPVPDMTYAVDLSGEVCHAATVEEFVYAAYATAQPPASPDVPPTDLPVDPTSSGFGRVPAVNVP
jgi:hypothetical protein